MTLRPRLALTILATAVPLVLGLLWLRHEVERSSLEDGLREFVLAHMQSGGREMCEESPERFPPSPRGFRGRRGDRERGSQGPGPGRRGGPRGPGRGRRDMQFWAYHPDFHSSNPEAMQFPEDLRAQLEGGEETASEFMERDGRRTILVATRMPWDEGPCAIMLVRRGLEERGEHADLLLWGLVTLGVLVLAAVLLAAGPIVRRIRLLQHDVRQVAASKYGQELEVRGGDELADLARSFNEAGHEVRKHITDLEARERTLRSFVADTSHDMMIPLTVLQGHLASIRKQLDAGVGPQPELVRLALEEAHYMGSLMHNLSAAAKLEGGTLQLQKHPVDLNALVERVAGRHETVAKLGGISLDFAVPEAVVQTNGDVTLIEQAVSNIAHNAVRYNRDGGHVSMLLSLEDGSFALTVTDDGPGVSDEQLQQLPERSFRSEDARTRDPNGLGLGLSIARDVAKRHGFSLTFAHAEGGGLEVLLRGKTAP